MAGMNDDISIGDYCFDGPGLANRSMVEYALEKLLRKLGEERIVQLAELIQDVEDKTGYGNVSIVINDRRVETIKQEFSYK
jgi:hypothetical protein